MGTLARIIAVAALAAAVFTSASLGESGRDAATSGEVLLAAGDIAVCGTTGDEATADLLDGLPGTIVAMGDLAYESGTAAEFTNCYDPTWGRHKARTHPAPGNHEYQTAGATGYYGYFGAAAGDPAKGYYSFDLGEWHIIALNSNSNCAAVSCAAGSAQEQWLRQDLATTPSQCTIAFWHHPRFSSGTGHGNNAGMQPFWQALYDWGADIVLVGHEHVYERFGPQTPTGVADPSGPVQFTVGTGGRGFHNFGTPKPNSLVRHNSSFGVLRLTLDAGSYDFDFVPVSGTFEDSGADVPCVSNDEDGDTVVDESDNCVLTANVSQTDTDLDATGDACDADDDNDGCADVEEAPANPPTAGGDRDALVQWDFFDVPVPAGPATGADGKPLLLSSSIKNQAVSLQDVGVVLAYVGRNSSNAAYSADNNGDGIGDGSQLDRRPSANPAKPWQSGAPNGAVSLQDVGVALTQVGHSCIAAP